MPTNIRKPELYAIGEKLAPRGPLFSASAGVIGTNPNRVSDVERVSSARQGEIQGLLHKLSRPIVEVAQQVGSHSDLGSNKIPLMLLKSRLSVSQCMMDDLGQAVGAQTIKFFGVSANSLYGMLTQFGTNQVVNLVERSLTSGIEDRIGKLSNNYSDQVTLLVGKVPVKFRLSVKGMDIAPVIEDAVKGENITHSLYDAGMSYEENNASVYLGFSFKF